MCHFAWPSQGLVLDYLQQQQHFLKLGNMAAKWNKYLSPSVTYWGRVFPSCRNVSSNLGKPKMYSTKIDKKARRKEIIAEFKKGYFADIKEYQQNGGKRFMALNNLISKEKALPFPTFTAQSLSERKVDLAKTFTGHATLLLIAMRGIAQPMCDLYREPFVDVFKEKKNVQYYELNAVDSRFYGLFRYFINKSLKTQIPKQRHDNFLCYYGSTKNIKQEGLVGNVVVGHAFLIDCNGLVRWRACAKPTNEEIESLITCTQRLL